MRKALTLLLCALLVSCFTFGASALTLETVETARESAAPGAETALAEESAGSIIPQDMLYSKDYGTLIYFNDFETCTVEDNEIITSLGDNRVKISGHKKVSFDAESTGTKNVLSIEERTDGSSAKALKVTTETPGWAYVSLFFESPLTMLGKYTIVADIYIPEENSGADIYAYYYPYAGNSTSRSFNAKSGTAWNTDKAGTGFELVKDNKSIDKFQFVDTSSSAAKGKFYYIDNVRIYYKPTQLDWQPGLNLLTGNEAPFDFEGVTNEQLDALGWERRTAGDIAGSIWNIAEEQENTFLSTKRQYRYISPCQWKPIEADRPIALSLKVKTNSNDGFYILVNAGENTSIDYKFYDDGVAKYTVRGVWDSRTFTLQKNDGNTYGSVSSGVFNDIMNNGINSIAVGFGYCSEGTYIDGKAYGYIDDYSIIPYYKVTYHVGTGEFVDYVLPADGLFTPDPTYCYGASTYKVGEEGAWQDISTPYTLEHEDIDVYINFSDNVQTLTEHSIRTAGTQALRFSGSVSNEIIKGNESSSTFEFGFIVSRGDYVEYFAAANGITDEKLLTFDGADVSTESANGVYKNSYGLPFVYGSSYRMLNGTLKKNQTTPTDQASFFTAALTGIPDTNYKTPICGRTYVRIGDLYFYGEVEETSVYDVAKAMLNDGGLDSETAALIQGIIDKVDGTSTASET